MLCDRLVGTRGYEGERLIPGRTFALDERMDESIIERQRFTQR
jgi:hypothetical protein